MLGARIAALRRQAGWSQGQLADRLGVSPSAVGMYEQGRREPSNQLLVDIAELFGVSTDYLLRGDMAQPGDAAVARQAMEKTVTEMSARLKKRSPSPFTKQELTVLLAAMLLEP